MNFRYDINGLRAIAVIAVVLFHFNPAWVPGGFAGVDVFFVISGFLMTGIIFRGLENNDFKLFKFYVARANRIIPALAILCLILLVFGWFFLNPLDYRALGKHVASSMGFISNAIYWRESGYFAAASHEKWLLHTWSLSVEWQFYIIYPIVLVALKRFLSLENLKRLIVIGTVLGFGFSVIATMKWSGASYYLLPTRAWEMMMGGVAFLYPWNLSEQRKKFTEVLGLVLILVSYAFVSSDVPWPGYFALIPVLGAYLVIVANRQSSVITNNRVFQCLGKCSYSIYLWHWPVVVLFSMSILNEETAPLFIVLSLLLGWFSYKYIESFKFKSANNIFYCAPVYFSIFISLTGGYIFKGDWYNENSLKFKEIESLVANPNVCHIGRDSVREENRDKYEEYLNCRLADDSLEVKGLLWGDSYAGHLDPMVQVLIDDKVNVISRTVSYCFPALDSKHMLGPKGTSHYCSLIRSRTEKELTDGKYEFVLMAGRWELMYEKYGKEAVNDLMRAIRLASENAKAVYVFSQPIHYKNKVSSTFARSYVNDIFSPDVVRKDDLAKKLNHLIKGEINASDLDNVTFLSREILYGNSVPRDFTIKGIPYTLDEGHLNVHGSLTFAENFKLSNKFSDFNELLN